MFSRIFKSYYTKTHMSYNTLTALSTIKNIEQQINSIDNILNLPYIYS